MRHTMQHRLRHGHSEAAAVAALVVAAAVFCLVQGCAALPGSAAAASSLPQALNKQIIVNAACERAAARLQSCQLANVKALGPEGVQASCCQPYNDLVALNCFW